MKKYIATIVLGLMFLVPSVSSAASFTQPQINAIVSLLQAFNVDAQTITLVYNDLTATTTTSAVIHLDPILTPQVTTQSTGSSPTNDVIQIPMPQDQSAITVVELPPSGHDPANGIPYEVLSFKVRVLDTNGATVDNAPVSMSVNGAVVESRIVDTVYSPETKNDHYTTFQYTPQDAGSYTFTFTSGNLTKEVTVAI